MSSAPVHRNYAAEPAPEPEPEPDGAGPRPGTLVLQGPLAEVYATYFANVWRGLRRLGVPESLVDDAAQDVFLVVHRRWADFQGRSSLKTWIYGIVLRVAKDYRRAEGRHAKRVARLATGMLPSDGVQTEGPADALERREANQVLHAVLGALGEEQREVFLLVELEQVPVREAAEVLGLHVRACQRRLRAAREAFEAGVAGYFQDGGDRTHERT